MAGCHFFLKFAAIFEIPTITKRLFTRQTFPKILVHLNEKLINRKFDESLE